MANEALNATFGFANMYQNDRQLKDQMRRHQETLQYNREKFAADQANADRDFRRLSQAQEVDTEYKRAMMGNMEADNARMEEQAVFDQTERIFRTTGDPNQALGFLNEKMGTDFEFMGAKDDWITFGSKAQGQHAWNWRTGDKQTLVEPERQPEQMRSYNQGSQEITEFIDPATGQVVRSAKSPRWKPGTGGGAGGQTPPNVMDLTRAYNSNLKGIATQVGMYLKPEQRQAMASLPEDSPLLAQVLAQSVNESEALPPEVKQQILGQIEAINNTFLPAINRTVGVQVPQFQPPPAPPAPPAAAPAPPVKDDGFGFGDVVDMGRRVYDKIRNPGRRKEDKKGKALDKAKAVEFMRRANGDREKARKLAREEGYEF